MSGIRDCLDRDGYRRLSRALSEAAAADATGEVEVTGRPGGAFHFSDGLVVAVESPGAPGPEALLLRSGRVTGEQWAELMREPGAGKWPAAGLIAHGYAGAVQLRVVSMMAMQDAVFAILAGRIEECAPPAEGQPLAPIPQGEPPARLLHEATRKLAALAALPHSVRPDGERPAPTALAEQAWPHLPHSQRELLQHADGRRTARDIAFRTGRSVYTVTAEISRMIQEGHLTCPGPEATPVVIRTEGDPVAALRPRRPAGETAPGPGPQGRHARPSGPLAPSPPPRPAPQTAVPLPAPAQSAPLTPAPAPPLPPQPASATPASAPSASVTSVPAPSASVTSVPAPSASASSVPAPSAPVTSAPATPAPAPPAPRQGTSRPPLPAPVPSALASLTAEGDARQQADTAGERAQGARPGADRAGAPEPGQGSQARAAPTVAALPRRRPGASGMTKTLDPGRNGTSWKGFFRLRSRGSGADA